MKIRPIFYTDPLAWEWVDGSHLDYTYWAEGEPDGEEANKNCDSDGYGCCAGLGDGYWYDAYCSLQLRFLCQKRKGRFLYLHLFTTVLEQACFMLVNTYIYIRIFC